MTVSNVGDGYYTVPEVSQGGHTMEVSETGYITWWPSAGDGRELHHDGTANRTLGQVFLCLHFFSMGRQQVEEEEVSSHHRGQHQGLLRIVGTGRLCTVPNATDNFEVAT